jgi:hypothetical protein
MSQLLKGRKSFGLVYVKNCNSYSLLKLSTGVLTAAFIA